MTRDLDLFRTARTPNPPPCPSGSQPARLARGCRLGLGLAGALGLALAVGSSPARAAETAAESSAAPVADANLMELDLESLANLQVTVAGAKQETILTSASTVSVIDRKAIEDYNFPTVSAAVETVAGVQVLRTYLKQSLPTSRGILQDHYANKVLVMINNVPVWHGSTGEGELDRIGVHDVERIEVLRGPGSVIYGSQAYSGAINIVLRDTPPGTVAGEAHAGFGSEDAFTAGGNFRWHTTNGWSLFASVNRDQGARHYVTFTDQGTNAAGAGKVTGTVEDYLDNQNVTLRAQYQDHSLLLNAYQQDEGYFGVTPLFASGAGNNHDVDGFVAAYTFARDWTEAVETDFTVFFDMNQRNLSRRADDSERANVLGYRTGGNLRNRYAVSDAFGIELGGDYEFRKSVEYVNYSTVTGAELDQNNMEGQSLSEYSLYAQADYSWKTLRFLAGARYTHNELTGDNVSPRGTIAWQINSKNALKVMFGESFRSPSLFEHYFIPSARTVFGDPNLNPEKNDTLEIAYQYAPGKFYGQLGVYQAWYSDKIFRAFGNFAGRTNVSYYANGEEFTARGIELELRYQDPKLFDVFLNADYVDGDDGDAILTGGVTHYNFKYVPDFTVSAGLHRRFGPVGASLVANYVDDTQSASADVDAFVLLDFNLYFRHKLWGADLRHTFSVRNLLDDEAMVPEYVTYRANGVQSLPMATDRAFYYTLTVNF